MLIMKVKKVRQSQPHWHTPHNKKFVQHIRTPHVLGTTIKHKYCINSREARKKTRDGSRLGRSRICKELREVRSMFRTVVGPGVIYKD